MMFIHGLNYRETLFLLVSFFFILYNAFPLLGDLMPVPPQFVCIFTTISLALLYPFSLKHKAVISFFAFILILFVNGIMGRYVHINGLANDALPLTWRLLIEIAWVLPALLIMSILSILNSPKLYKIIGYGSVIILTISFLFILPVLISSSNILREAMQEEELDFVKPIGLPDYTLMHAYTFMLPALCLFAKVNSGRKRILMMCVIALFYYVILQTAVTTSITLGTVVIIAAILYNRHNPLLTILSFLFLVILFLFAYSSDLILKLVDGLMPYFEGTAVQFKLEDLHSSILAGRIQGGSFEGREALHTISQNSFLANPFIGGGKAGGHSQVFDILGTVGIIGFIPFALILWYTFKNYFQLLERNFVKLYLIATFIVPFIYLYHKGIFGATGWLFMCVIAPCLIIATYCDYWDAESLETDETDS